jgi:fumarate reductase subunit C
VRRTRFEVTLWALQRASAAVLAVCVTAHLATNIYAVQGGLSAAEILGRTRGSPALALFYGVFVAAIAVHAPIGLRTVLREMLGWQGHRLDAGLAAFALFLAWFGWRAVGGLVA